jgi:Subtilase family
MRLLRRPEFRLVVLIAIGVAAWLTVRHSHQPAEQAPVAQATSWRGLVGDRHAAPQIAGHEIVVLRTPSIAQRLASVKLATEATERRWVAEEYAAQQQVLTQLARHGFDVRPDYTYARVLDGFSATLGSSAVALLERSPEVAGVYPVRAAYPAAIASATPTAATTSPHDVGLPGFPGTGITIALLDTGVDLSHPYLHGRVEPGIDIVGGTATAQAQHDPQDRRLVEQHGTQLAGLLVGSGGPGGLHGVAPGATVLPIRVAGWQPTANGGHEIYARSDQLIAGLERAVDPNGDGDTHDAARIALLGVAEPFASFPDSPEAQAIAGARRLDTLVVVPAGNDGAAGPLFGSIAGPGGSPAALVVGATDSRSSLDAVRLVFHRGPTVLDDGPFPLLGGGSSKPSDDLAVAVPGAPGALHGDAALLPAGSSPTSTVTRAVAAGARAVLLYGRGLPPGSLGDFDVPVVGIPPATAASILALLHSGFPVQVAVGAARTVPNPGAGGVVSFSSRGLTFAGDLAPQLSAPGTEVETSDFGDAADGEPAFTAVSGTSVSAAFVAGEAARLAEARPGLGAADLASLLTGSTDRGSAAPTAAGSGSLDVGASAAGEVAASLTTIAFGPWTGPAWHETQTLAIHNVSTRSLDLALASSSSLVSPKPASVVLAPGATRNVKVVATATRLPSLALVSGLLVVRPAGGQALRVPWTVVFRPPAANLLPYVRLSATTVPSAATKPAVLTVVAGAVGRRGELAIQPVARLDVLLYSASGGFLGELTELRDLLPGTYSIAVTGRGPGGAPLPAGSYQLRLAAYPELGHTPSRAVVRFRIQ